MDTSKEYIKMCEKAEEIQRLRPVAKLEDGDFIADWRFKDGEVIVYQFLVHDVGFGEEGPDDEFTWWLPRQDQLQEMLDEKEYPTSLNKINRMRAYAYDIRTIGLTSMEQLWLAFVMKEKYNKTWEGETWNSKRN